MKRKSVSIAIAAATAMSLLAGCGSGSEKTAEKSSAASTSGSGASQEKSEITVGSVIMNKSGEWFAEVIKGQQDAAKELGVTLNIVSSDNEVSKESDNVSAYVAQGVDALVISPLSTDGSAAAVDSALEADIPVVAWNTNVDSEVTSYIGVSAEDLGGKTGVFAADYIKKNFPDGCKLAILGNSSYEIGIARCDGFKAAIQDLVDEGKVEIVNEQDAELQDEGLDTTEQILTANPDVQMIWCWNQTSLLGCASALENAARKDIVLLGTDMSVELAKDMQGDDIDLEAITTQQPYQLGYQAVENAVKAVKGEKVEAKVMIPVTTYTKSDQDAVADYIEEHKGLVEG